MSSKTVKYINKDFDSLKLSLQEFIKTYYPEYKDFSDSGVGMMFVDLLSYVGDVNSFYIDNQIQENFIDSARNLSSVYKLASFLGYNPKLSTSAYVTATLFQIIPSKFQGTEFVPDWRYALNLQDFIATNKNGDVEYIPFESIDMSTEEFNSTPEVYETDEYGDPQLYLIQKDVKLYSGTIVEYEHLVTENKSYYTIILDNTDIIDVLSIIDSDGNKWYKVDSLAQSHITEEIDTSLDSDYSAYKSTVNKLLKYTTVSKRFVTNINKEGKLEIQFGANISNTPTELLIPGPHTIEFDNYDGTINPLNLMLSNTYGESPQSNTTLFIKYLRGGDQNNNSAVGEITKIKNAIMSPVGVLNSSETDYFNSAIKPSLAIYNSVPAVGARGAETVDEIRINAKNNFASQNRCVTTTDYELRILSMNPKYGSVAKVKVISLADLATSLDKPVNQFALDAYCLAYDDNKNLVPLNEAIQHNLIQYLSNYKMATDVINLKTAYVINIGVNYEIITEKNVINKKEVLLKCNLVLKDYFDVDKWQIGQPILLNEIYNLLNNIEGVRSTEDVTIINKYANDGVAYSNNYYNIKSATFNNIIYTAVDASIFEVKTPDVDIKGKTK